MAAARTDILLDNDGDFPTANQTPIGISDMQHIADIFISHPGAWKETPAIGIGVYDFSKTSGSGIGVLERTVKMNLQADGYNVNTIPIKFVLSTNTLLIDATKIKR